MKNRRLSKHYWLLFSISLAVFYWLLEAIIDAFVFYEDGLLLEIFSPRPHEIWMRSIIVAILIVFGVMAQYYINSIKEKEEKIEDLYSLLLSIRNINQMIVQEPGMRELFAKSADILSDTRGYIDTQIGVRQDGKIVPAAHAGEHDREYWWVDLNNGGNIPKCVEPVLKTKSEKIIESTKEHCKDCEICDHGPDHKTVLVPMLRRGSVVGTLSACMEKERKIREEEIDLLDEVASDLAYAREKILMEEKRKESERKRDFLNTLLRQDIMSKNQVAAGYLQLLEQEEGLTDEGKRYLKNALQNNLESIEIIQEVRRLREIEGGGKVGKIDINRVLKDILQSDDVLKDIDVDLRIDIDSITVVGNSSLEDLFNNLIHVRKNQGSEVIEIDVEVNEDVLVVWKDDGDKLSPGLKKNIFKGVYTGETAGISGFRYYIINELAEHNEAEIEVDDSELGGAKFGVRLKKV